MGRQTLGLVALGLALRLFLIFPGPLESKVEFFTNKADLRNYYWPSQAALRGENPYALWASGQSGEFRADMTPLELVVFVATAAVWNDPRALQVLFALFDALNMVLLGVLLERSRLRLPFQIFYALGPLTIYNLVLVPQDKTILLTLTFLVFYLLAHQVLPAGSRRQEAGGRPEDCQLPTTYRLLIVIVAALLASFKWLSVFYLVPLLIFISRDWRDLLKYGALFGGVMVLTHLLWFPDWLYVYQFRAARTAMPMHIAPAVLLNALGWFDKNVLLTLLAVSLAAIYALFWFKRIDIFETIALSVMAGILWTPDMDPVHLSIIVLHFLLIINWSSRGRLIAVWGLSAWVAAVYALSTRAGFTRYGLPDPRLWIGAYGSLQMIVLSYVMFVAVLAFYVFDKWRGYAVGCDVLIEVQ